jgi:fructose-bisphosphate aldolase, class II
MQTNLKCLLDHAANYHYAIPAFNVNNIEQISAVTKAAVWLNSPIIFQVTSSAIQYAGLHSLVGCINHHLKDYPNIPYVIHRDHAHSIGQCTEAANHGFTSVMIDGSLLKDGKTPSNFDYNVDLTKRTVELLFSQNISVEGELGVLGSLESKLAGKEDDSGAEGLLTDEQLVTSVEEAKLFAKLTGVDALAIAIGTSHGAYKFKSEDTSAYLNLARIAEIHEAIPEVHLVLHGASSIPQSWIEIINNNGGEVDAAQGVPEEHLLVCVKNGIKKINIDTDLRVVFIGAMRLYLNLYKDSLDIRKMFSFCIEEMIKLVSHKYEIFGCVGQASKF